VADGIERRQYPRLACESELFCYLDGVRVDARSENISAGGMLLRTAIATPKTGQVVGLVFPGQQGWNRTTFLFGRVVRLVEGAEPGAGLRWEKAVTTGSVAELTAFLEKVLGIRTQQVAEVKGEGGQIKSVYTFPPAGEASFPPAGEASFPPAADAADPGPDGGGRDGRGASHADMPEPARVREPAARLPADDVRGFAAGRTGSLTLMISRRDLEASASIQASIAIGGSRLLGRLTRVGRTSLFFESAFAPLTDVPRLVVRFDAGEPGSPRPIQVTCRLVSANPKDGGLDLQVVTVDEGGAPGAFDQCLRRLQFRSLAGS